MDKKSGTEHDERPNKNYVITFRILQAFSMGMFVLGVSSAIGDYSTISKLPFTVFSITTTTFGLFSSILTGSLAKTCEKW